jgi:ABC-2 type transport system permease protein
VSRVLVVARREYLERVRSKAFIIATVLGPILLAGITIVPALLAGRGGDALRIAVLDDSGSLRGPVEEALSRSESEGRRRFLVEPAAEGPREEREKRLKEAVRAQKLDGYLHLPSDVLEKGPVVYYGRNVSNAVDLRILQDTVSDTLVGRRLAAAGLDSDRIRSLTRKIDLTTIRVTAAGEREDRGATMIFAIVLMMILYTTVLMWGQAVMTGVIEEKASRVVEVIASSVPSVKLLAGKLLGVGAAGLTQFLVWSGSVLFASLGAAAYAPRDKLPEVSPLVLVSFVVFFLLGYALYSSLFAAVGACVNTTQEAQSLAFPVFMPLVFAVTFFPIVLQSPDGRLATVLSLVPLFTPLLMFLRITILTPPMWQIALGVVLTATAVAGVVFLAARIYRVGILMYGKRPTFPEIMRWISRR